MDKINVDAIRAKTQEVLKKHDYQVSELIAMLQEIQEEYHYLPKEALNALTEGLDVPAQSIYGVATFYAQFSLNPKGKYLVRVCDGTACHVKNSAAIFDALEQKFNFKAGKNTTEDGLFTLETVACLGACGISPVMVVNGQVYPQMTPDAALVVIDELVKDEKEEEAR